MAKIIERWKPGNVGVMFQTPCGRVKCIELPLCLDGSRDIRIWKDGSEYARVRTAVHAGQAYRRACAEMMGLKKKSLASL